MGEFFLVQLQQFGASRCRAKAADGAGVVKIFVVVAAHGGADAGGDFVTDDDRAHQRFAGDAARLRERQRSRDGRRAGVVNAVAKNIIDFGRVGGAAVDQSGSAGGGDSAEREARFAVAEFFGERRFIECGRWQHCAGQERGEPVDDRALGVMRHVGRDRLLAVVNSEAGELFNDAHFFSLGVCRRALVQAILCVSMARNHCPPTVVEKCFD